jgi:hypothetical protein
MRARINPCGTLMHRAQRAASQQRELHEKEAGERGEGATDEGHRRLSEMIGVALTNSRLRYLLKQSGEIAIAVGVSLTAA